MRQVLRQLFRWFAEVTEVYVLEADLQVGDRGIDAFPYNSESRAGDPKAGGGARSTQPSEC